MLSFNSRFLTGICHGNKTFWHRPNPIFSFCFARLAQEILFWGCFILMMLFFSCGGCGSEQFPLCTEVHASCTDCISSHATVQLNHYCTERCKRRSLWALNCCFHYAGCTRKTFIHPQFFLQYDLWSIQPNTFNQAVWKLSISFKFARWKTLSFPSGSFSFLDIITSIRKYSNRKSKTGPVDIFRRTV